MRLTNRRISGRAATCGTKKQMPMPAIIGSTTSIWLGLQVGLFMNVYAKRAVVGRWEGANHIVIGLLNL